MLLLRRQAAKIITSISLLSVIAGCQEKPRQLAQRHSQLAETKTKVKHDVVVYRPKFSGSVDLHEVLDSCEVFDVAEVDLKPFDLSSRCLFYDSHLESKIISGFIEFSQKDENTVLNGCVVDFDGKRFVVHIPDTPNPPMSYAWIRNGVFEIRFQASEMEAKSWRVDLNNKTFLFAVDEGLDFLSAE